MKVIFIVGPRGKQYIDTYNDTIKVASKRPWLEEVPKNILVNENGTVTKTPRDHVRIDYAVAYCIKWHLRKTSVNFSIVPANKITEIMIKSSDLVFWHFFDKLVRPPIKSLSSKNVPNGKYQDIIDSGRDKMFPPPEYQKLVYDKCAYYKFFQKRGINVAPSLCINRKNYMKNLDSTVNKLWKKTKDWGEMFGKPVHGTDSQDVGRPYDFESKQGIRSYLLKVFGNKNKYPAIVFQKFMVDFELNFPQIRMYYLGDRYQYSVVEWKTPIPNGTSRLADAKKDAGFLNKAKPFARRVLKAVEPFYKGSPKFLTRIDVGCCIEQGKITKSQLFLNEIECLAGLYLYYDGERKMNFEQKMAKQAIKVIQHKKI